MKGHLNLMTLPGAAESQVEGAHTASVGTLLVLGVPACGQREEHSARGGGRGAASRFTTKGAQQRLPREAGV